MSSEVPPPTGPPPSYEESSTSHHNTGTTNPIPNPDLLSPTPRNGIPPIDRRSMEDEQRPLPEGWLRQYDPETHHQFFVDTTTERSIWHHPLDDEVYLKSLKPEEREEIGKLRRQVTLRDIEAESSDEEGEPSKSYGMKGGKAGDDVPPPSGPPPSHQRREEYPPTLPQRPAEDQPKGFHKLGRKLKDNVTGSTHAEREAARKQRAEEERAAYAAHQAFRRAMSKAVETGEPQLLGKDKNGKEVWVEPPQQGYYGGGGYGGGGYGGGYGYNPYQGNPYNNPNVRYVRPNYPYQRPYGYGYGGGLGAPLVGGLLGGALLGGLLF